ncbi:hypothetical protein J6590_001690 [Homalodisca vitripennis]|nr:hypothetical protein J6590_001690 [Homalodisca vitripennis]
MTSHVIIVQFMLRHSYRCPPAQYGGGVLNQRKLRAEMARKEQQNISPEDSNKLNKICGASAAPRRSRGAALDEITAPPAKCQATHNPIRNDK